MRKLFFISLLMLCFLSSCANDKEITFNQQESFQENENVIIYISGEVLFPGVYEVKSNSIYYDIIQLAGGFTKYANIMGINLAKIVVPNEMIFIPYLDKKQNLVNINSASLEELLNINGLSKSKAVEIINYRQQKGYFQKKEELLNVKGIGNVTFNQIKNQITI